MSKPKPKDKKTQPNLLIQKDLQQAKKQLLDATFTIKKLQQRLQSITIDNRDTLSRYNILKQQTTQQISKLKNIIDVKQQQITQLLIKSSSNEIQKKQKQQRIIDIEKTMKQQIGMKNKEIENMKQKYVSQIREFESRLKQCDVFMSEKQGMEKERERLREDLELLKIKRIEELADKDRERILATQYLKNDMLQKINQTKVNLLSLRKQQLSTTTRLTVLQNHQLTSQLQYQSKQTQKLIYKNQQLQLKVTTLQRQLQIHKQVQQQLSKRSHFSQKIIKKLSQKIKQLQQIIQSKKNLATKQSSDQQKITNSSKNSQIISALQKTISTLQKKYQKLENDNTVQKNQVYYLQTKLQQYQSKVQKVGCLLSKYLDEILENKIEQGQDENYVYNLEKIKNKDVKEWERQDVETTVILLLNIIKPFLNKRNVGFIIEPVKKNVVLEESELMTVKLPRKVERKTEVKSRLNEVPLNIATKIVGSSLREWGKTVNQNMLASVNLSRLYKVE